MQQEAELKRIKAETNAKIREAQVRGMAQTAAAVRDQAKTLVAQKSGASGSDQSGVASAGSAQPTTGIFDTDPA
ncbi:MAG: hypothetical protein ACRDHP_08965, partial [Ktedonobacterales bacterium]